MQGSARKDVVFGAARVYTATVPGPKWKSWLKPVLDGVRQNLGADPKRVLADAGYQSKSNLEMLEQTSIEGYIATGRQKDLRCKQQALVDGIKYQRLGEDCYYAQELFE